MLHEAHGEAEGLLSARHSGLPVSLELEGRGPGVRAWLPPPPWLVWMPEQSRLGPGNKSEALGRAWRGWACSSPQPSGLQPLAASSVFPGERLGFLLAVQGLLGREDRACQLLGGAWRPGARAQLSSGKLGAQPPPTRTSASQGGDRCQVTCRGQQEPEAPARHLTQEAGRVLSVCDWHTGVVTSWPGPGSAPAVAGSWLRRSYPAPLGLELRRPPCCALPLPASLLGPQS